MLRLELGDVAALLAAVGLRLAQRLLRLAELLLLLERSHLQLLLALDDRRLEGVVLLLQNFILSF